jgi:hypothetical protein
MQNIDGMQKKLKMHAVSMTPHARSTNDSNGPELSYLTTKKIYKFKGTN